MQMPSPGAVCPAIVVFSGIDNLEARCMVPDVLNMIVRGPVCDRAHLREPSPLSLRFVTKYTCPPLPPVVYLPKPSAPGKAGVFSWA